MNTYFIKKSDLDSDNFYTGPTSYFDGHLEANENLGTVKFKTNLITKGYICFKTDSGIEAGEGIKAGFGIEAGLGIKAGEGIKAGFGIEAGEGIKAGLGIKAGEGIEAREGIKAGFGIEAGEGIKAGLGIEAGLGIVGKTIQSGLRIFAGLCIWRLPFNSELEIKCQKLISGTVASGNLVIIEPKVEKPVETIKVGSLVFDKNQVEKALAGLVPIK
jgi:hypothetical protein